MHPVKQLSHSLVRRVHAVVGDDLRLFTSSGPSQMGRRSAKIATRKESQDALKSKLWSKLGKQLLQAARQGGTNPDSNGPLREVIASAKSAGLPKEVIQRNLKKADDRGQEGFSEVLYEAFGPANIGHVIECLTNNPKRAIRDVRSAVIKTGGKLVEPGCVLFSFRRVGHIIVPDPSLEEQLFGIALDAGAEDVVHVYEQHSKAATSLKVQTDFESFGHIKSAIREANLPVDEAASGLVYQALESKKIGDEELQQNSSMMHRLLALEDVDQVYNDCSDL